MSRDCFQQIPAMCANILQHIECTNLNTLKMSDKMSKFCYRAMI